MKCVRYAKTNEVKRISNEEAEALTKADPNWKYTTKSVWKAEGRH